mgnify:CR=1 FL=1|tara:strand:+ start:2074 stop:2469 length:396 start_codon:yes stop_codon:yes gene_type:complete
MSIGELFARAGSFFKSDEPSRKDVKAKRKRAAERTWRKVCREVDIRDDGKCRACSRRTTVAFPPTHPLSRHRHHIVFRSQRGPDTTANVLTLCAICHADVHAHWLEIIGNANGELRPVVLDQRAHASRQAV